MFNKFFKRIGMYMLIMCNGCSAGDEGVSSNQIPYVSKINNELQKILNTTKGVYLEYRSILESICFERCKIDIHKIDIYPFLLRLSIKIAQNIETFSKDNEIIMLLIKAKMNSYALEDDLAMLFNPGNIIKKWGEVKGQIQTLIGNANRNKCNVDLKQILNLLLTMKIENGVECQKLAQTNSRHEANMKFFADFIQTHKSDKQASKVLIEIICMYLLHYYHYLNSDDLEGYNKITAIEIDPILPISDIENKLKALEMIKWCEQNLFIADSSEQCIEQKIGQIIEQQIKQQMKQILIDLNKKDNISSQYEEIYNKLLAIYEIQGDSYQALNRYKKIQELDKDLSKDLSLMIAEYMYIDQTPLKLLLIATKINCIALTDDFFNIKNIDNIINCQDFNSVGFLRKIINIAQNINIASDNTGLLIAIYKANIAYEDSGIIRRVTEAAYNAEAAASAVRSGDIIAATAAAMKASNAYHNAGFASPSSNNRLNDIIGPDLLYKITVLVIYINKDAILTFDFNAVNAANNIIRQLSVNAYADAIFTFDSNAVNAANISAKRDLAAKAKIEAVTARAIWHKAVEVATSAAADAADATADAADNINIAAAISRAETTANSARAVIDDNARIRVVADDAMAAFFTALTDASMIAGTAITSNSRDIDLILNNVIDNINRVVCNMRRINHQIQDITNTSTTSFEDFNRAVETFNNLIANFSPIVDASDINKRCIAMNNMVSAIEANINRIKVIIADVAAQNSKPTIKDCIDASYQQWASIKLAIVRLIAEAEINKTPVDIETAYALLLNMHIKSGSKYKAFKEVYEKNIPFFTEFIEKCPKDRYATEQQKILIAIMTLYISYHYTYIHTNSGGKESQHFLYNIINTYTKFYEYREADKSEELYNKLMEWFNASINILKSRLTSSESKALIEKIQQAKSDTQTTHSQIV